MAIDYCKKHDKRWDRDWYTDCPMCLTEFYRPATSRIEISAADDKSKIVIRRLMDGYPFQAHDKELHDECKRVLGEA